MKIKRWYERFIISIFGTNFTTEVSTELQMLYKKVGNKNQWYEWTSEMKSKKLKWNWIFKLFVGASVLRVYIADALYLEDVSSKI